jgi:hypothetical protein
VLNPIPPSLFPSSGKIVTRKELFEESIHRTTSSERVGERNENSNSTTTTNNNNVLPHRIRGHDEAHSEPEFFFFYPGRNAG